VPAAHLYLLLGLGLGMGTGMSIVLGRKYGSSDQRQLRTSVAAVLVIGLVASLLLTVISGIVVMPLLNF